MGQQMPRLQHLPLVPEPLPPDAPLGALGREIIDLSNLAGLELDPWQAWIMEEAHNTRSDRPFFNPYTNRVEYKWAAFEVGVMVSRQNGKGSILEARELAGLFLFGERLIIHSAHQHDTSLEAFERIKMLIENTPDLDAQVAKMSNSHGVEGIQLKNGQRLRFRTRTKGGGRGFTCDCLILDEAMYLNAMQVAAIFPTLSARPNPQVWVTGSAGEKESEHFGRMRSRALNASETPEPLLMWAEWSINGCNEYCYDGCTEHDPVDSIQSYAAANPALGRRISVEFIEAERRSMDPAEFAKERLGVGDWPVDGSSWLVIGKESWMARVNDSSQIPGRMVLAIDTSPDLAFSCITAVGYNDAGDTHVEITGKDGQLDSRPGTEWVLDRIKAIWEAQKPYAVVIDKAAQAGMFVTDLEDADIKVITPNTRQYAQTCGELKSSVSPKKGETAYLVHGDQAPLNAAVGGADTRITENMWAWARRASSVDISPLISATLGMWGLKEMAGKHDSMPMMAFGGRIIG